MEITKEFASRVAKKKLLVREILLDGPKARAYIKLAKGRFHQIRLIKDLNFPGDLNISRNSATISQLGPEIFGLQLTAPEIVASLRGLFEALWVSLEEPRHK